VFSTVTEGPWAIVGAIAAIVGAAVVILASAYEFLVAPWWRRRALRRPCRAWFLISALNQRNISHAMQDQREHRVSELTLRSDSEFEIEMLYEPAIDFEVAEIYFGCEAQDNTRIDVKPIITSFCNRFIERGTNEESPDSHPDTNYTDHHKYYHLRKHKKIARGEPYSLGFKMKTRQSGRYEFRLVLVGEEVGHTKNKLFIRVEDVPTSRMRCVWKPHRWQGCFIQPASET
jgi:hypothetical protein